LQGNPTTPTTEPGGTSGAIGRPASRLSFAFSVLSVAALVLIPITWNSLEDVDRQFAFFGSVGCALVSALCFLLAVLFHRRIPWLIKLAILALPGFLVWGFLTLYEFSGFDGEVRPQFRLRAEPDRVRTGQVESPATVPSIPETEQVSTYRFSQFLGSERNGVVDSPEFSMRWDSNLPSVVWRRGIGAGWSGFAIANGLAITLQQQEDSEVVSAWKLDNGETAWEHKIPGRHFHPLGGLGPRSTPTIVNHSGKDWVLVQSALGMVVCLSIDSGEQLWKVDLLQRAGISQAESEQEVMWGRSGSPLIVDDLVIVPMGGSTKAGSGVHSLIALDLSTGAEQWVNGEAQIAYSSPALLTVDGVEQIVSVNEGKVTGHEVATGKVLWESPWPSKSNGDACASQPVQVDGTKILLGKGYAQGSKLIEVRRTDDTWTTKDIWSNTRTLKTKFTNSVVYDGMAYALSDGILECVMPLTGKREWRGPRFGQGQMVLVNGTVLVVSEDGRIASVDRTSGKLIAEMSVLEGITWNPPSVAGPYLLVRNATEAVCLCSPLK
jgi:outer membrane protein assembly factor BamB